MISSICGVKSKFSGMKDQKKVHNCLFLKCTNILKPQTYNFTRVIWITLSFCLFLIIALSIRSFINSFKIQSRTLLQMYNIIYMPLLKIHFWLYIIGHFSVYCANICTLIYYVMIRAHHIFSYCSISPHSCPLAMYWEKQQV